MKSGYHSACPFYSRPFMQYYAERSGHSTRFANRSYAAAGRAHRARLATLVAITKLPTGRAANYVVVTGISWGTTAVSTADISRAALLPSIGARWIGTASPVQGNAGLPTGECATELRARRATGLICRLTLTRAALLTRRAVTVIDTTASAPTAATCRVGAGGVCRADMAARTAVVGIGVQVGLAAVGGVMVTISEARVRGDLARTADT